MFARIHIIAVFVCIGIGAGIVPQFSLASPPNLGRDLFSFFRPNHSPVATDEVSANPAAAVSHHRLARTFAEQGDVTRANANFSLALQNAAPRQVAAIATDYAAFLKDVGDLHRAELMLRQALAQSPNDTEIVRMLARCLVRQDKMAEGLRHFRSIGSEAEARAEIMAIYREQGNTDMLAVAEQRWGSAMPETTRSEPVSLIAATSRPPTATARPEEAKPEPEPTHVARAPRPAAAPPLPGAVLTSVAQTLPVASTVATPEVDVAPARPVLANTVRLAVAPIPMPVVSAVETKESPRSMAVIPTAIIQPRRHYVINAGTSADLKALLPIVQPAVATVSVQGTQ